MNTRADVTKNFVGQAEMALRALHVKIQNTNRLNALRQNHDPYRHHEVARYPSLIHATGRGVTHFRATPLTRGRKYPYNSKKRGWV